MECVHNGVDAKKEVLLVLVPEKYTRELRDFKGSEQYNFHHLDVPEKFMKFLLDSTESGTDLDLVEYIERGIAYVQENKIDAVLGIYDLGDLVSSIIKEMTGLKGTGIEETFVCQHKYYTRKHLQHETKLWYSALDLEAVPELDQLPYPCLIKSPLLDNGRGQIKVDNKDDIAGALDEIRQIIKPWKNVYEPIFSKYINREKFPWSLKNIVLVEEFIQDRDVLVTEGWVDDKGRFFLYKHNDGLRYSKPFTGTFATCFPSSMPSDVLQQVEMYLQRVCTKLGLCSQFFNADLWVRHDVETQKVQIDIIEMNTRISVSLATLQQKLMGISSFKMALKVACYQTALPCEIPAVLAPLNSTQYAGSIRIKTFSSGKIVDILDFEEIRQISFESKTKDRDHITEIRLRVSEEFEVTQLMSITGFHLGVIFLSQPTLEILKNRGQEILRRILKNPADHFDF